MNDNTVRITYCSNGYILEIPNVNFPSRSPE